MSNLLTRATAGDMEAAKLILAYAIGKPGPAPDPDGEDQDAWQRIAALPGMGEVLGVLTDAQSAGVLLDIIHGCGLLDAEMVAERMIAGCQDKSTQARLAEVLRRLCGKSRMRLPEAQMAAILDTILREDAVAILRQFPSTTPVADSILATGANKS